MDNNLTENVFHLKNDDFYDFIKELVGQQLVDILRFQSINSTQSLIRNTNVFDIFNMNSSESNFLAIRQKSCFQLDSEKYIVKTGLVNNLNYLLEFLKQQQQKLFVKRDSPETEMYPGLSNEFINKHPLLKNFIDWYLLVADNDISHDDKHRFLKDFIDTIIFNFTKSNNCFRYGESVQDFATSLYILGGKLTYEFVRLNLPGSLPSLTAINSLISNSNLKISEAEFRFDELQDKFEKSKCEYAFGSEDMTSVIKRVKYDSTTDTFIGFTTPLTNGIPMKQYYKTNSFDTLKFWFNSIEKSALLNIHMIQPLHSNLALVPSPFLLAAYGANSSTTADDILQRWWFIFNQFLERRIRIIGYSTDADGKYLRAMRLISGFFGSIPKLQLHLHPEAFKIQTTSNWPWFYLRKEQLLLFLQDATHLVTKWRNRLLSSTAELRIGNKTISIGHLYDVIDNAALTKLDHGLTKSDINPKDRQNYSSCLKITSNDLLRVLSENESTRGTLIYLQMLKMIIIAYVEKSTAISKRLQSAWRVVFLCRLWLAWIRLKTFNTTQATQNNKSKYFITKPAYMSVELNAHNLLFLVLLVKQKQLPVQALNICVFNSQACESMFRNTRALSGIYSTVVNFGVHDFLQRAKKLSLLNDIKYKQIYNRPTNKLVFPAHYKHRNDKEALSPLIQDEIDQLNVDKIIADAYDEAVRIYENMEILDLLKQKHVLGLNSISTYIFEDLSSNSKMYNYSSQIEIVDTEEFELATDDDDAKSDDSNCEDFSSNNDSTDDEEQEISTEFINTTKKDFLGIKVYDKINCGTEKKYFKVLMNNETRYLHKQSACWLLTDEKNKLSTDRLLRVTQNHTEE